jgi:chemotaxis protein methyltransferase CheR
VAGAYVYYKECQKDAPPAATEPRPVEGTRDFDAPAGHEAPKRADRNGRVSGYDKRSFINQTTLDSRIAQADTTALHRGRALLESGHAAEALDALRHIVPRSESARQALTLAARAHADRGDLDLAVAEIHRSLEIDTMNDQAYFLLGMIYSRQGQWEPAAQQFERARYLRPTSELVSFYLAEAYRNLGQPVPAAREYRNALRKLEERPPGELLDGVAVGWLCETCRRHLEYLRQLR